MPTQRCHEPAALPAQPSSARCSPALAVYRHGQARPDALAVAAPDGRMTYAQLARTACGLARQLRQHSAWPGPTQDTPRVGILASRSAQTCVAVLAAHWAGATYVPINLKLPEERIVALLAQCRLSALLVDLQGAQLLSEKVRQAAPPIVHALGHEPPMEPAFTGVTWIAPRVLAACEATAPIALAPDDAAYIMFTSGTTGVPKGVVVSAGALGHYLQVITRLLELGPADRVLEIFELSFDVSAHNMFSTWEAGASLHVLPATRVMSAVAFAREHALTVWTCVPSLVGLLRQVKALRPGVLPALRLTAFGGEPLTRGAVQAWREAAPDSAIYNLYGPTEATVSCLAQRVDEPLRLAPGRDVVAIGKPLPGSDALVLDAAGRRAPEGAVGELAIAGVQLATGYLDAPALTAERFVHLHGRRWYRTGDLALRDGAGYFHCLGRVDHQVKVMGHRVELEEVDAHLRQVLGTDLAATLAWPLVDGVAQGLVAFVGGTGAGAGSGLVDEAATVQALRSRLPGYMVPARVITLASLPVNANGKIDRQALRLQLLRAGAA